LDLTLGEVGVNASASSNNAYSAAETLAHLTALNLTDCSFFGYKGKNERKERVQLCKSKTRRRSKERISELTLFAFSTSDCTALSLSKCFFVQ
jgi:hypothetical protein